MVLDPAAKRNFDPRAEVFFLVRLVPIYAPTWVSDLYRSLLCVLYVPKLLGGDSASQDDGGCKAEDGDRGSDGSDLVDFGEDAEHGEEDGDAWLHVV